MADTILVSNFQLPHICSTSSFDKKRSCELSFVKKRKERTPLADFNPVSNSSNEVLSLVLGVSYGAYSVFPSLKTKDRT